MTTCSDIVFVSFLAFLNKNLSLSKGGRSKHSNCVDFGLRNIQSFSELTQLNAADFIVGINEKVCTTSVQMRRWLTNLKRWNLGMGMYVYQIICIYNMIHTWYMTWLYIAPVWRWENIALPGAFSWIQIFVLFISVYSFNSFMKAFTREHH